VLGVIEHGVAVTHYRTGFVDDEGPYTTAALRRRREYTDKRIRHA